MRWMMRTRLPILLAGVAILVALVMWAGLRTVERAFAALGLLGITVVILIHLPLIAGMGAAWWSIGRDVLRANLLSFTEARLVRDSVADLLPFSQIGGFAAGVRLLSLNGVPAQAGALSLIADLLMEFFSKFLYAAAGIALLVLLRPGRPLPSSLLLTLALLAGLCVIILFLRDLIMRFAPRIARRWALPGGDMHELGSFLAPKRLWLSGVLHTICWAFGGIEAWVMLRLMGVQVTIVEAVAIDSLVMGLRTFGFWVPAALGVQEAAYVLVCALFGFSPGIAIALSLVRRARDIVIGILGLAIWQGAEITRGRQSSSRVNLGTAREPW